MAENKDMWVFAIKPSLQGKGNTIRISDDSRNTEERKEQHTGNQYKCRVRGYFRIN